MRAELSGASLPPGTACLCGGVGRHCALDPAAAGRPRLLPLARRASRGRAASCHAGPSPRCDLSDPCTLQCRDSEHVGAGVAVSPRRTAQRASPSVSGDGARFRTSLAAPGGRSVPVCGVDRPAESDRRAAHFASFPAAGSQAARNAPQVAAPRAVRSVAKPHCDSRVLSLCPLDSTRKSLTFTTSCPLVPKKRP